MNIKYFDIHSHLHSDFFKEDENEIVELMKKEGVFTITVGVDYSDSRKACELAERHENIFASVGQHPVDKPCEIFNEEKYQKLINKYKSRIVCVGECGLDYYWLNKDLESGKINKDDFVFEKQRQEELFKQQIDFAVKNNLPLMLHVRSYKNADGHSDAFKILDKKQKEHFGKIRANFHFFTESPEIASEIQKRGFMISFPGVITFADLNTSVASVSIENMMSETDSPFASPKPHRGKVNKPLYVKEIVSKISEIKQLKNDVVERKLLSNAFAFFDIPGEEYY